MPQARIIGFSTYESNCNVYLQQRGNAPHTNGPKGVFDENLAERIVWPAQAVNLTSLMHELNHEAPPGMAAPYGAPQPGFPTTPPAGYPTYDREYAEAYPPSAVDIRRKVRMKRLLSENPRRSSMLKEGGYNRVSSDEDHGKHVRPRQLSSKVRGGGAPRDPEHWCRVSKTLTLAMIRRRCGRRHDSFPTWSTFRRGQTGPTTITEWLIFVTRTML